MFTVFVGTPMFFETWEEANRMVDACVRAGASVSIDPQPLRKEDSDGRN